MKALTYHWLDNVKVPLTPKFFFILVNFRFWPDYFGEKVFGPGFSLQMLYLFKVRKVSAFFGPWKTIQVKGSSLLCYVISAFHLRAK